MTKPIFFSSMFKISSTEHNQGTEELGCIQSTSHLLLCTWQCRYNVVGFLPNPHSTDTPYIARPLERGTVYPKKYAHGFCFAVLCCGYTLTDFPISIRLTSLALWQSNDCPSASKATLMNMDKYFMWIHYERLHNHNKAKHNKTVCIFLGIYCMGRFCEIQVWFMFFCCGFIAVFNIMIYSAVL